MNDFVFNSVNLDLKVNQIVCLEHHQSGLYGEVIQLIPHRNLCWFRPLCLVISNDRENVSFELSNSKSTNYQKADAEFNFEHWQSEQQHADSAISRIDSIDSTKYQLIDLQSTSDLLWPTVLFKPAFDLEAINFIAQLNDIRGDSIDIAPNYRYLNKFVQQFWQANQDKF